MEDQNKNQNGAQPANAVKITNLKTQNQMENQNNQPNGKQPVNAAKGSIKLKRKIERCIQDLQRGMYEREEVVKLCLLALLSGEHVFMLGSPGVAKSMLAERITKVVREGKLFTHLMTRYTQPEELFGPFSISKLTQDIFERKTDKKLPAAEVVFLDEIWKSNSNILNTLLTVLNERKFHNGSKDPKIDLHSMICASNELPQTGNSLEALYDRLLIRICVEEIKERDNMKKFLLEEGNTEDWKIRGENQFSLQELKEIGELAKRVKVPEEIADLLVMLKEELAAGDKDHEPIAISGRRMKKIIKMLRVSAWVSGREKVNLNDCALLSHCVWNKPEQRYWVTERMEAIIRERMFQSPEMLADVNLKVEKLKQCMKKEDIEKEYIWDTYKKRVSELEREIDLTYQREKEKRDESPESIFFNTDLVELSLRDQRNIRTGLITIKESLETAYQEYSIKAHENIIVPAIIENNSTDLTSNQKSRGYIQAGKIIINTGYLPGFSK